MLGCGNEVGKNRISLARVRRRLTSSVLSTTMKREPSQKMKSDDDSSHITHTFPDWEMLEGTVPVLYDSGIIIVAFFKCYVL